MRTYLEVAAVGLLVLAISWLLGVDNRTLLASSFGGGLALGWHWYWVASWPPTPVLDEAARKQLQALAGKRLAGLLLRGPRPRGTDPGSLTEFDRFVLDVVRDAAAARRPSLYDTVLRGQPVLVVLPHDLQRILARRLLDAQRHDNPQGPRHG